jgi:hypothetical protein
LIYTTFQKFDPSEIQGAADMDFVVLSHKENIVVSGVPRG